MCRLSPSRALRAAAFVCLSPLFVPGCTPESESPPPGEEELNPDPGGGEGGAGGEQPFIPGPRALVVNEPAALETLVFKDVLTRIIATTSAPDTDVRHLYRSWWDAFNRKSPPEGALDEPLTDAPHCDESSPPATLNGFPITCPRGEGELAETDPFTPFEDEPVAPERDPMFHPVAAVNRFDLAPPDGAHCGQYRLVFAQGAQFDDHLLIFEAQLPNPTPELGLEACRPLAEFWQALESPDLTPAEVAARLHTFFFDGLEGFPPVIDAHHYGLVTVPDTASLLDLPPLPPGGRIGSNMLMDTWALRQFVPVQLCDGPCELLLRPTPAQDTPFLGLFHDEASPLAKAVQDSLVASVETLARNDLNTMTWPVPEASLAGESNSQTDPPAEIGIAAKGNTALRNRIQDRLSDLGSPLTPDDIYARATVQTCAGCHSFFLFRDLGDSLIGPRSHGFTHIDEQGRLSDAMFQIFLPHRRKVLDDFLASEPSP